jgi:hypothetical protein
MPELGNALWNMKIRELQEARAQVAKLHALLAELVHDIDSPGDAVSDELMARCRAAVVKG